MIISYERQERAVVEFTKQPERYINLALRSDLKIQLLLSMFILDSIVFKINLEVDDIFRKLFKKIPREILTDLKRLVNSENSGENTPKEVIDQLVIKYSLSEEDYEILKSTSDRYSLFVRNYDYVVKWIEGAVSALRQEKLTELGL
jgi:hypothetical protein